MTTLTAMAALHPYEDLYFNALVDTKTPGALAKRYDMDWAPAQRQLLEYLLARYPDDTLRVWPKRDWFLRVLPQKDRDRVITLESPHAADFYLFGNDKGQARPPILSRPWGVARYYLHPRVDLPRLLERPPIYAIHAYGNLVASLVAKDVEPYHAAYDDVATNGDPLAHSDFDIYAYDGALYYLSADCPPPAPSRADFQIFLHITPADIADLPAAHREFGFENRDFRFDLHTAFFDGKCVIRQPLPDYAIERIATGVYIKGELIWSADINLAARAAALVAYDSILAGDYGAPVAQSDFDLYLRGNALTYLKESCAEGDADARFFLHITPSDPADLPPDRRERGFANLDFHFADHGAYVGDICAATRALSDYPIERIRTGQFVSGEGAVWCAEVELGE